MRTRAQTKKVQEEEIPALIDIDELQNTLNLQACTIEQLVIENQEMIQLIMVDEILQELQTANKQNAEYLSLLKECDLKEQHFIERIQELEAELQSKVPLLQKQPATKTTPADNTPLKVYLDTYTESDLQSMNITQLRKICSTYALPGYSKYKTKGDLRNFIKRHH